MSAQIESSLIWKVSGKDLSSVSYLYGTYHSSEPEVYFLMDTLKSLLSECEIMTGEVTMEADAGMNPMSLMDAMLMENKTLADFFSEEQYKFVDQKLKEELGFLAMLTDKIKPIYTSIMLTEGLNLDSPVGETFKYERIIDDSLQVYSKEIGLKVYGLETPMEALKAIDLIPLEDQAEMLLKTLEGMESLSEENPLDKLTAYYVRQDLQGMLDYYEEQDMGEDFENQLLVSRNDYFVERVLVHMKNKSTFCAVGCLHLPGETGMIHQFRELGYTVEPIYHNPTGGK